MHTTVYFLTEALDYDDADGRVSAFLDSESFYDYYSVLPGESGPLEAKREILEKLSKENDYRTQADDFLRKAEKEKGQGHLEMYGFYLRQAGMLYEQLPSAHVPVYNLQSGDYSIPGESRNWFAVAVDFHI